MRDYVADPTFLLQKKIEAKFSNLYPTKWLPLYSQVTFSNIRYSVAYKQGQMQNEIMDQIMKMPDIEKNWDQADVMNKMLELSKDFNFCL
jgi:kynurenine 3-monooxygenase